MRLFTALLPPPHALDGAGQLAGKTAELQAMDASGRLRWADRANWHVTLAFYGEVEEDLLPALRERLARAAARGRPLRLRIAGGGHFGRTSLWAGVAGAPAEAEPAGTGDGPGLSGTAADVSGAGGDASGTGAVGADRRAGEAHGAALHGRAAAEGLRRLAAATAAAGRRAGAGSDDPQTFRAHLTLARARSPRLDLRPYVAALSAFEGEPWTAGELVLVRSNLPESGVPGEQPRYEPIASWPLGG